MTQPVSSVVYGIHAAKSFLRHHPTRVDHLYLLRHSKRLWSEFQAVAQDAGLVCQAVERDFLEQYLPSGVNHQGVCLVIRLPDRACSPLTYLNQHPSDGVVLLLDGVQDPHNLGAILRVADASCVAAVIAPKDGSVGVTPTVSKVSCGAASVVPFFQVTNLARVMRELQQMGYWLYGTHAADGTSLFEAKFSGKVALVMGAEGRGLRRKTQQLCDFHVSIPMLGSVSSLNVAVSTGIILTQINHALGFYSNQNV